MGKLLTRSCSRVYNDSGGSGTASNEIEVKDEGIFIGKEKVINFIGSGVYAKDTGNGQVNIYIPPPAYTNKFNELSIAPIVGVNRYISNPLGTFHIGDWQPNTIHKTVTTNVVYTSEFFSIKDLTTTFTARVTSGANEASCTANLNANDSTTNNNITINVTDFSEDNDQYKAKLTITINIQNIITGGRFDVALKHSSEDYTFSQSLFYDSNPNPITISEVTVNVPNNQTLEFLSGVAFFEQGTILHCSIGRIWHGNTYSYPLNILTITPHPAINNSIQVPYTQLNNWNPEWNCETSLSLDIPITQNIYVNEDFYVEVIGHDFIDTLPILSNRIPIIINTLKELSTNDTEHFSDELLRLTLTNSTWDSQQKLDVYDGGLGLQVVNSRLVYPQNDFSLYNPSPNPDYSRLTGTRSYLRSFYFNNTSKTNGTFELFDTNITEQDLTNEIVTIEISLDNNDFYTLNEEYTGGTLYNNDGCRIYSDEINLGNHKLAFTLGQGKFTHSNTGNGWGIFVKISFVDSPRGKEIYLGGLKLV